MKIPFILERKVTVGELLTLLSILFSLLSVLVTWRNDQEIQLKENATKMRIEIAKALNMVEQTVQIQLSFYERLEQELAETSRISTTDKDPVRARDFVWEQFYKHRAEVKNIIYQSDWEIGYANLLTYGVKVDTLYIKTVRRIKSIDLGNFNRLKKQFADEVQLGRVKTDRKTQTTRVAYPFEMTDRLRVIKDSCRDVHIQQSRLATAELKKFFLDLIASSDKALLFSKPEEEGTVEAPK